MVLHGLPSALARVSVFEATLVVRELELDALSHRRRGVLAFAQQKKIAQGRVRCEAGLDGQSTSTHAPPHSTR